MPPLVQNFSEDLHCIYKDRRKKPHSKQWPPYQPTSIVNVTVIHYKNKQTQQKLIEISKHFRTGASGISKLVSSPPSHCMVTKDINEIFREDPADQTEEDTKSKPPKFILIEGAPGIGKTVLAKEIAYLWADHKLLTDCKLVILIYLRDPRVHAMKSIEELLRLYATKNVTTEVIDYLEKCSGQNVAFVFDGFDEFPTSQEGSIVMDIIGNEYGRKFCRSIVVVTSRPTTTLDLCKIVDRRIEILGFAPEERDKLISLSFSQSPDKRVELEKYFREHPLISSLCYIPLNLAIVLYLFHQGNLPETLTEINESFVIHTVYRHIEKVGSSLTGCINHLKDMPKNIIQILWKISKLAFEGLQKDQLVFTFYELRDVCPEVYEVPEAANGLSLLQAVQHHPQKGVGTTTSFNFLHLTMQEYLAAYYVATLPEEQQQALLREKFWDNRFNFMWIMYVGTVGVKSGAFASFAEKISAERSRILGRNSIQYKMECLHLFQCYMEDKTNVEIPQAVSSIFKKGKIRLTGITLLSHRVTSLLFFMTASSVQQWKSLVLSRCNLQQTEMYSLLQNIVNNKERISTLRYVDLSSNNSSPWGVYCAIIRNCSIDSLTLCGDEGMKEYVKEITDSLQANTILHSLTLFCVGKIGVETIKVVLMNNFTIKRIYLSWERINDSKGVEDKVLMHTSFSPNIDDMMQTKVTANASRVVDIRILYDDSNHDDDDSWIRNMLFTPSSFNNVKSVHIVDLSHKKINNDAAHVLAFGLCNNTTVEELNISHNAVTSEGAIAIIDCLKYNKTLAKLDLSLNEVSQDGMKKILEYFESQVLSVSLEYVDLSNNSTSSFNDSSSPWGPYCAIIRYCCSNSLTLCGDKGMEEYIKEITDSLQVNTTLQSLSLYGIGKIGVNSIKTVLMNNLTLRTLNLSWQNINDSTENKILIHTIFSPSTDNVCQSETTLNDNSRCVNVNILYDDDVSHRKLSSRIVCNLNFEQRTAIKLSGNGINDNAAHVLAFGLCNNTTVEELNILDSYIADEGAVAIIDRVKYNKTLKKLDLSHNKISINGMKDISDIFENQVFGLSLEYVDLSKNSTSWNARNSLSPWGPYCAIIRHCCGNSLTLCGDKGMEEYIKEITHSLQANTTLQSLSLFCIGKIGLNSIETILMNNVTLKEVNLSWEKIKDRKSIKNKILLCRAFSPNKTAVDGINRVVDINILYNHDVMQSFFSSSDVYIQNFESTHIINLSRGKITTNGLHVLAFGLYTNTTIEQMNISYNKIKDEGAIAIIDCLKRCEALKKLDLSNNKISNNGINEISENIKNKQITLLQYVDLSGNISSPWGVYCVIIKHCCTNSLTLCGDKGMEEYIKEITDSLQANITLQSLSLYNIGKTGVNSIKTILMNNVTLKRVNLSWIKINDSRGIEEKIIMHAIFSPSTDDSMQTKTSTNRAVDISILYDKNDTKLSRHVSSSNIIVCTQSGMVINLSSKYINDDAAHVLAFGLSINTTVEELNISHNYITSEGTVAIIESLRHNKVLKKLDLSYNKIGFNNSFKNIGSQGNLLMLEYFDLNENDVFPWAVYCVIIRHCGVNNLTLVGDGGMEYYIQDITDSLQTNKTLQSLTIYGIGKAGVDSVKAILVNTSTLKRLNLSWKSWGKINNSEGIESKILMHGIFSHHADDLKQIKTTVHDTNRVVDVNILYNDDYHDVSISTSSINLYDIGIDDDAAHVLAFGLCINTTVEELNVSHNCYITDEGSVAIIQCLKHNKTLKKLDLSHNGISKYGMKKILDIFENQLSTLSLEYIDLSNNGISENPWDDTNSPSPWGVYCAIIRHCCSNSLTLCGDKGIEIYIKEITDSLQINTTLQSLTLYNIREYELQVFENAVSSSIKCESLMKEQKAELWKVSVFFTTIIATSQ